MQEPCVLRQVQKHPTRKLLSTLPLWAEPQGPILAADQAGAFVINTDQVRLKINVTPQILRWLHEYPNLEIEFRDDIYAVISRQSGRYTAILTCESGGA